MKKNGQHYADAISKIRAKLIHGVISYDEAKKEAAPIIAEMNKIGAEIAKKYNRRPTIFTFSSLMR